MTVDDHELAQRLASAAGRRLVELREQPGWADGKALGAAGDQSAHELLISGLEEHRPDDTVLSEHGTAGPPREPGCRTWIVDPLDGTREYGEAGRDDWAVHVALAEGERLIAAAVALPARDLVLEMNDPPKRPDTQGRRPRVVASRSRPPEFVHALVEAMDAEIVPMGSAGAKIAAVVLGDVDIYVHGGGQYEWDSAAPVAVARAAGLHTCRLDASEILYNQADPWLPDLVVCRPDLADRVLAELAQLSPAQEA